MTNTNLVNFSSISEKFALSSAKNLIRNGEKSSFKLAVYCRLLLGEHVGSYVFENKLSLRQLAKELDVSAATVSRWTKAVALACDRDWIALINSGLIRFNQDKIILIAENWDNVFKTDDVVGLFKKSYSDLKAMLPKSESDSDTEYVEIIYLGKKHQVPKSGLEALLKREKSKK